jgi:ribosomal protein S12 methylthiotransferase accessory factor YcaO
VTGLKLRDDAYYVPTSDGVWILTPAREVMLTGRSIFQWVDRLAPYLDGRHTLAELTAALPADRKQMAEKVITVLCERGVVVEVGDDTEPARPLAAGEKQLYRPEIAFLGYSASSGERSFQAYRDSIAVLVGAGQMLAEIVAAALCSGSRQLRIAVTDECPTDLSVLADSGRRARQHDPRQRITRTTAELADERRLADLVAGTAIVVYASDRAGFDQARVLDRACARADVPFVAAVLAGDDAWLGPFGLAPTWTSAWRRLCALDGADPASFWRSGETAQRGDSPAGAVLTVVANQLVREVVRLLSGTATLAGSARMTRIGLRSLRTERHAFLPHPFSLAADRPARADLPVAVARLRRGKRLDPDELSARMAGYLQARLGVLVEVTEGDFAQIPLAVAQVRVSDPVLLLEPGVPLLVVTGAGLSLAEARRAAVLRGLAAYGSLMVDPRRLHVRGDALSLTGDPGEDLAALRAGQWSGFVWGHGLADRQPHALAAEVVFPALRRVRPGDLPPPGAAAGYDWPEAVRVGLIGQCRRLALAEIDAGRRRFRRISLDDAALDPHGGRYRSMAKIIGGELCVYDVTGSTGMPTLAFCRDGVTIAYASGFSFGEALRDGLAEVLLSHQAEANGDAAYAPPSVPPLPERGRLPGLMACPTWSTDVTATAARLARLGWKAVAVPLDHDPAVTSSVLPYLVNVVVTRD